MLNQSNWCRCTDNWRYNLLNSGLFDAEASAVHTVICSRMLFLFNLKWVLIIPSKPKYKGRNKNKNNNKNKNKNNSSFQILKTEKKLSGLMIYVHFKEFTNVRIWISYWVTKGRNFRKNLGG